MESVASQPKRRLEFEFNLLPWQSVARQLMRKFPYLVVNSGVLTGKTEWGAATLLEDMYNNPEKVFWWVSALDWQVRRFWDVFRPAAVRLGARCKEAPHCYAEFPRRNGKRGARLFGVTAKSIESLSAYHPWGIYGDELAKISSAAWAFLRIRMLRAKRALLMSTPRPNFWGQLVKWGKERHNRRWAGITVTTEEAGLVDALELAELKEAIPHGLWLQEVMAMIVAGAGAVFENVDACAVGKEEEPVKGERYLLTYDPAKLNDYGWVSVWRGMRQVWSTFWQETAYKVQAARVANAMKLWNMADCVMDAQGPGEGVLEMLEEEVGRLEDDLEEGQELPGITPVRWDNALKARLVRDAQLMFERENITLIDPECGSAYHECVHEHKVFERRRTSSGLRYTYEAPEGEHDDAVSATLLSVHGARRPRIRWLSREPEKAPGEGTEQAPEARVRFLS